jgi:hypothetical protein
MAGDAEHVYGGTRRQEDSMAESGVHQFVKVTVAPAYRVSACIRSPTDSSTASTTFDLSFCGENLHTLALGNRVSLMLATLIRSSYKSHDSCARPLFGHYKVIIGHYDGLAHV